MVGALLCHTFIACIRKLPESGMSNIDVLTSNVIQLPSIAKITFSRRDVTDPGNRSSKQVVELSEDSSKTVFKL